MITILSNTFDHTLNYIFLLVLLFKNNHLWCCNSYLPSPIQSSSLHLAYRDERTISKQLPLAKETRQRWWRHCDTSHARPWNSVCIKVSPNALSVVNFITNDPIGGTENRKRDHLNYRNISRCLRCHRLSVKTKGFHYTFRFI